MSALRRVIGPNVTLVTTPVLRLSRMTIYTARLRADAGQVEGQSIWWGFIVQGELSQNVDGVWYAIRTDYERLGWQTSNAAARILDRPMLRWRSLGLHGRGAWQLRSREFGYATVLEPDALATERRMLRGE